MPEITIKTTTPKYNLKTKKYLTERQIKQKDATVEGVVVNNFIKNDEQDEKTSLKDTYNALLIPENNKVKEEKKEIEKGFDTKKALIPLVAGALSVFAISGTMGALMKNSAKKITTEPFKNQLPAMGINLNIVEETHFATYMALRDPSRKNLMAAGAVFSFSAITLVGKKFIEGVKEIWTKKQEADIQKDLQESLIEVETSAFSGKLDVVRDMLSKKGEYFKSAINGQNQKAALDTDIYKKHFNFKGKEKEKNDKKKINPYLIVSGLTLLAGVATAIYTLSSIRKSGKTIDNFTKDFANKKGEILENILNGKADDPKKELMDVLIKMGTNKETAKDCAQKIGLKGKELEDFANTVAADVDTIWGNAPTGMSTESGKSFFYCYINEARGHLYNWLVHSENKFLKDLFIAMSLVSAGSFISQQTTEALKNVAVLKENAKTDLDLQKRLVNVEIENFRAKKESAIKPLIEDFEQKRKEGRAPEELKVMADNILLEIKNGPPFVYS